MSRNSEKIFYDALQDIFIGAQIEGSSGFINLMRIKTSYYEKILTLLKHDIDESLKTLPKFREELFDKLFTFFKIYFSSTGSIFFNETTFDNNVYEKVYSDDRDVLLFWKTHMLYYVKSDIQAADMEVIIDGKKFRFDVSDMLDKRAWEKRGFVYEYSEDDKSDRVVLLVKYATGSSKTDIDELLTTICEKDESFTEIILERAIRVFEKQNEIDFFINRDVNNFLKQKFDLWLYRYVNDEKSYFNEERIKELKVLREIAIKVIDFISQFEEETLKIWQKPKFIVNSSYVVTLDRINVKEGGLEVIRKILKSPGIKEQEEEWRALNVIPDKFTIKDVIINNLTGPAIDANYKSLPIDLKYFPELKYEILSLFDNLDEELDGWLINSENWQALNTIMPKFSGEVQTIYIDPPFIKVQDPDYYYKVNFKDATWLTLLQNRLELAKEILKKNGSIFVCADNSCDHYTHVLLNEIFENFRAEIIWCYEKPGGGAKTFKNNHLSIYYYGKSPEDFVFNPAFMARKGEDGLQKREGKFATDYAGKKAPDWWDDIPSFATAMTARERMNKLLGIQFPTQQPEKLLQRAIEVSTNKGDMILDFFLGSATSTAVAHKLGRKWIGIELGEHFNTIDLPRMKLTLRGKKKKKNGIDMQGDTKMTDDIKWKGGGFFKYYSMEQYEDTLKKVKYGDSDPFLKYSENPYNEYIFMKDEKLLEAFEIDYKENKVKVNLNTLHENIDIAETISNLTGRKIKVLTEYSVIFDDGEEVNLKELDFLLIKPLIWWEA